MKKEIIPAGVVDFQGTMDLINSAKGNLVQNKPSVDMENVYPDAIKSLVDNEVLDIGETSLEKVQPTAVIEFLSGVIKEASEMVKVATNEVKHLQGVTSNLDNEMRAYKRRNLPASILNASPEEIELLYAEHRFINAAEDCLELISSLAGDKVEELKMAYGNLEKQRATYPELYKQRPKRWGRENTIPVLGQKNEYLEQQSKKIKEAK